ncbi:hypothetical protein [Methylorubrum extorquens]
MAKDHANWLISSLQRHSEVTEAIRILPDIVRVDRRRAPSAIIGVISANPVQSSDYAALIAAVPQPVFILNIPKLALWTGESIAELKAKNIAWGKMYDLYRALNSEDDLSDYRNPSLSFVERYFRQHQNVIDIERIYDQVYRLHRGKGEPLLVALTDAYEVTADTVRTAYDLLAPFDILLKNTPYGRISSQGSAAAKGLGVEVCDQSSILDRISK